MSNEVVLFDTEAMRKRIAGVVHAQLAEMIPQAAVDALVREQEQLFLRTILPGMVQEELKRKFGEAIHKYVEGPEFAGNWASRYGTEPGKAVKEIIQALAPDLVQALFGEQAQRVIDSIRQSQY